MKTNNRYHPSHKGDQPIRVLQHNMINTFETTHSGFLKELKQTVKAGLKKGIVYVCNNHPIYSLDINQTPYVDVNKTIYIHETFCSYLWCISYALVVLYEEETAKMGQNRYHEREINMIDREHIQKAILLFGYAKSSISSFTVWDQEKLTNPELYSDNEAFWVEKANSLYLYAINFILCHEYAHVKLGHLDLLKRFNPPDTVRKRREVEADNLAIELMFRDSADHSERTLTLGVLMGLLSILFLNRKTSMKTHPHTDERIHRYLMHLDLTDEDPIWAVTCIAYKLWDTQFGHALIFTENITNYKEMYDHLKQQVGDMRNKNG